MENTNLKTSNKYGRKYNFSPGPACLPVEVLEEISENLFSYSGSGIGVMELSHRGPQFEDILNGAKANISNLLGLSSEHEVLFMTGGASTQFSVVPMSLAGDGQACYIETGTWSTKAIKEAKKFSKKVNVVASSKESNFSYIPKDYEVPDDAFYLHFTGNNTVYGTQYFSEPKTDVPLICDASSDLFSHPIDISKYGLLYGGAQKNLGIPGVTICVIRKDLLERVPEGLPSFLDYRTYASSNSLSNTPPTFPIYVAKLITKWLLDRGGVTEVYKANQEKAGLIYQILDSSSLYYTGVSKEDRSLMNIPFNLGKKEGDSFVQDKDLESKFLSEAQTRGLMFLKGYRTLGGVRVSIYNAFPKEGVEALAEFMKEFEKTN